MSDTAFGITLVIFLIAIVVAFTLGVVIMERANTPPYPADSVSQATGKFCDWVWNKPSPYHHKLVCR